MTWLANFFKQIPEQTAILGEVTDYNLWTFFWGRQRRVRLCWGNRRSVSVLFCVMKSITERQKSCSQGNGAQESNCSSDERARQ